MIIAYHPEKQVILLQASYIHRTSNRPKKTNISAFEKKESIHIGTVLKRKNVLQSSLPQVF